MESRLSSKVGPEDHCPLVSVVIPSFNHEKYVWDCIRSVVAQDYENIELIIIDDGSGDSSVRVISGLIDECLSRFHRFEFRSRENVGLTATLNEALGWCQGKYFSAIASDDLMGKSKTSTLVEFMESNDDVVGVFSGHYRMDGSGEVIRSIKPLRETLTFEDIIFRRKNVVAPTQLLKLDCLKKVGGYREDVEIEDFYMCLALTKNGDTLAVIEDVLVGYRQHDSNYCGDPVKMYEERVKVLNYFDDSPFYHKAMSINLLLVSNFYSSIDKGKALKHLSEGVILHKRIIFTVVFVKSLTKLFFPKPFLIWVYHR